MKIHTLDLYFQELEKVIAVFAVETDTGCILIESGPESTRERSLQALASAGFAPEQISAVFVTHIHLDHAGAAGWWAQQGVPVYVHPKGERHLIDPSRLIKSARMVYQDRFDSLWGAMLPAPADNVYSIADQETVEVAGLRVTALDTPGHAFHHHCFQIEDVVFAGDAAGASLPGSDFISVTSAPPQFDLHEGLRTLERLSAIDPHSLYLTHYGEVTDPQSHLKEYRRAWELNAQFVKDRLSEKMDPESLQVAYQAFQMEQAFREGLPGELWSNFQAINHSDMCADGIRLYWEKNG